MHERVGAQAMRVLTASGNTLYVEHDGAVVCLNSHETEKVMMHIALPGQSKLGRTSLTSRLFRLGVHSCLVVDYKALVLVFQSKVLCYDLVTREFCNSFEIPRGKRFLFLCLARGNDILFGEYFGNKDREAIHIYRSTDGGRSFEIDHTFPAKTVRHIHGVFCDPYTDSLWVTTGDTNGESGIWFTKDRIENLKIVISGNQQTRAIQLLFTESHVYFGSDTPLERNFIYRLDKKTGAVDKLQEVESSVFWGCKVGDSLFFSTAVEPSKVNKCRDACIWGSKDGETWKRITRFRKDIWPMKLFQYGQIFFPSGENNTDYLWFTPFATEKHMTVQRLDVRELF